MNHVIFVSPHPDDIELFCGGALLKHVACDKVTIIVMTKGGKGSINPFLSEKKLEVIRQREIQLRHQLISSAQLIFAGFKDRRITDNETSISQIINLLEQLSPDIIYMPEFERNISLYRHRDHINTGKIFYKAAQQLKHPLIIRCYHSKEANLLININKEYYHQNNEAVKFYKSQKFTVYRLTRKYNKKRRQWGKENCSLYAEGFRALPPASPSTKQTGKPTT